ncbi:protein kinase domain-containing protein [Nonomuraea sp. H19]|uniref:serine/threonine-protein kinase n=1 Tax=Nonomuraea sp. H19 TaxID=3452206 RepID=UPI003F8921EA
MIGTDTALAGRYRLLSRLGAGGHGEVWRAADLLLERIVAVKMVRAGLDDDPGFAARFHAEARSMATIDHPGVAGVFDYGIAEIGGRRTPYLVMRYIDGEPLDRLLARRGRIAAGLTMDLVARVAEALQAAHDAGVVHRDVKPGNLMIRPDGSVVLADFGVARAAEGRRLTASGIVLGTAAYCAPEQAEGAAPTPAMDVYALGVVAYECLAGRVPFHGDSAVAVALKHLNESPPPLPGDLPPGVVQVVMRALAKDPAERWPSAAALATAARAHANALDGGRSLADGTEPSGVHPREAASASPPSAAATANAAIENAAPRDAAPRDAAPRDAPLRDAPLRDAAAGRAHSARGRRRALTVGGGLVAVVIAASATAWSLARNESPPAVIQPQLAENNPINSAQPFPDPATRPQESEPAGRPASQDTAPPDTATPDTATPETTADTDSAVSPEKSAESRAPAPGLLVGGIVYVGGPSPSKPAADGYRSGPVQVFNDKGKRMAIQRTGQRGFRFSLPPGRYRLHTVAGAGMCATTAVVKPEQTTRADLKCVVKQPPPQPAFQSAAIQDRRGDPKGGPNAGQAPPYADLLAAAMKGGEGGVTVEFTTAAAIPAAVPSEGDSLSRWTVSVEQDGETAILSITGSKGAWSVRWAAKNAKTGLADDTDQVTVAVKPMISGSRISAALGQGAPLRTAPIDFTKPYRIAGAAANVVLASHGWTDVAP